MIVLLTDFGFSEYVGVMKGVIYHLHKAARIVDLCHDISPQSVIEASWILKNNYTYFPIGAVFCCVVDPGVGTERKALGVKTADYTFVAPDNGLLWETLKEQRILDIRVIPVPDDASHTFHGRDVFAKAAATIDQGHFDTLEPTTRELKQLELYLNGRVGMVVRIDRFGNIITNLPSEGKTEYWVDVKGYRSRMVFSPNYDVAPDDELFLIKGSCKTLEISLKNGSANERLTLKTGQRIEIA
ncbi:MAG: SAM-dependent chlorinase/fluorinase [Sedimentisphaerales bacterium]|nr:SAM-dependent chlorinase/fluorinase [Sedimentisphaerales bacterium]